MGFEHRLIWLGVWWGGLGWGGLSLQAYGLYKLVVAQVQKNLLLSQLFWSLNSLNRHNVSMGVRAGGGGGARGAAAPPNFGQLRFFGHQEKILAKLAFKDVFVFFY